MPYFVIKKARLLLLLKYSVPHANTQLPGSKDGGESKEASVCHFVVSGEAPIDDPVEQRRDVRIELEQEHDGCLR